MLRSLFSIFPGIGQRLEMRLWSEGMFNWSDFLARDKVRGMSPVRKARLDLLIMEAEERLSAGDDAYFAEMLGPDHVWALWGNFAADSLCLDIETDGKSAAEGVVTVVGFYSRGEYRRYVRGENLEFESVQQEFDGARLLVSYFGAGFDLPYLKAKYPALHLDIPHYDLCPAGHRAGLKGGLKKVEQIVGIERDSGVSGMNGYDAVLLWRAWMDDGDNRALDTLISYNREDTVNLHALAWIIYERLREATGLPALMAAAPTEQVRHPRV